MSATNATETTEGPERKAAFPSAGILPKVETQATSFLQQYPQYDGRGVVVAVLDTGVDPGAIGLQTCPDGRPKVVDIIDCSGAGDVDTSQIVKGDAVKAGEGGAREVTGLTGRTLQLNPAWQNPSGEWRLGMKRAFELYPSALPARVKADRKKGWDQQHNEAEASVQRQLAQWKEAHPSPTPEDKKGLQDLEDCLSQLQELNKEYDDPGPIYDCLVWHDGSDWLAAIDTEETGDLTGATALKDYHKERQYATFSQLDSLNFCVNIYDEGNTLSIVADGGSHGTHVAGIVAAHHPEHPELNGLAPGAQIVSLSIGDRRLATMETGTSMVRAFIEAVRLKVDLINMSYGEAVALYNSGRVIELATEVVNKHGIIFVSVSGNQGPAMSTVTAAGGTTSAMISTGAYVSPSMMVGTYSMRDAEKQTGQNFTWSGVGPTADGHWGPTIMAPGGAIAPVPNWTLQRSQLMNGTSMASPNCCGNVALLLSGLKAEGITYSPHRVRKALENTAATLEGVEPLTQGHGLVQTASAWEYLQRNAKGRYQDIWYKVTATGGKGPCRGVYLRQATEVTCVSNWNITVEPKFHEDADNREKVEFELQVRLDIGSCSWIKAPSHLFLMHNGRSFAIEVDPTGLEAGVHFALVKGYDVANSDQGPVFEVPVTVTKPINCAPGGSKLRSIQLEAMDFTPGQCVRSFVSPPVGTQWLDVVIKDKRPGQEANHKDATRRMVVVHCLQLVPHSRFRDTECQKYLHLLPGQQEVFSMRVDGPDTVEIAVAQFWNSLGATSVEAEVHFRGVSLLPQAVVMHGGCGYSKAMLSSELRTEEVQPTASLSKWVQKVAPSSALISPLGARDLLPRGRQIFQLVLEYPFNQTEPGEVTPRLPPLNGYLYESFYESQLLMLFDANKRLLKVTDCWPEAHKCRKGDHVARVQVRHEDVSVLERLKAMQLFLERDLKGKEVPVSCYANIQELSSAGKAFPATWLTRGLTTAVLFAEPAVDKLPKGVKAGDVFSGSCAIVKAKTAVPGQGTRPRGFDIQYIVTSVPAKNGTEEEKGKSADTRPAADQFVEAVRDLKVSRLEQLAGDEAFMGLYEAVLVEHPGHLPLLQTLLHHYDAEGKRETQLDRVQAAADAIIKAIDQDELAKHFGTNINPDDVEAGKLRKEMETRKALLTDALSRKARALTKGAAVASEVPASTAVAGSEGSTAESPFKAAFVELQRWDDVSQDKYARLMLEHYLSDGRRGSALKLLGKVILNPTKRFPMAEAMQARLRLFEEAGWSHLVGYEQKWLMLNGSQKYAPF